MSFTRCLFRGVFYEVWVARGPLRVIPDARERAMPLECALLLQQQQLQLELLVAPPAAVCRPPAPQKRKAVIVVSGVYSAPRLLCTAKRATQKRRWLPPQFAAMTGKQL